MSKPVSAGRVEGLFRPNEELSGPFEEVTVVEYRGLRNLRLQGLGRVNLIAGVNNSGKTSLLEAMYLLAKQTDWRGLGDINRLRNTTYAELWSAGQLSAAVEARRGGVAVSVRLTLERQEIGPGKDQNLEVLRHRVKIDSLQAERRQNATIHETKDVKKGEVEYDPGGGGGTTWASRANLSATYRNDLLPHHLKVAHDESLAAGSKPKVIEFLRKHLDPGIRNVELTSQQGFLVSHEAFDLPQPLWTFGEGLQRILYLGLLVAASRGGLLLIDEIEIAIHASLFRPFTRFLHQLAEEFDVQIVATTHSQEAIQAFLEDPHQQEDIVAYTLLREGGKVVAERFTGPDLAKMIDTTGYDIRRL